MASDEIQTHEARVPGSVAATQAGRSVHAAHTHVRTGSGMAPVSPASRLSPTSRMFGGGSTTASNAFDVSNAYPVVTESVFMPVGVSRTASGVYGSLTADGGVHHHTTKVSSNPLNIWNHEGGFIKSLFGGGGGAKSQQGMAMGGSSNNGGTPSQSRTCPPLTSLFATEEAAPQLLASESAPAFSPPPASIAGDPNPNGDGGGGGSHNSSSDPYGEGEAQEREKVLAARAFRTRNWNALRSFAWDQRVYLPKQSGWFSQSFRLFASPRFWEKFDWTLRAALISILPTLILCLEPTTRHIFPLPTSVVALAFWISQPTLGAGLRELYIALKGFSLSLCILCIIISINPGPPWLTLLLMFIALLLVAFIAEEMRRTCSYCTASMVMAYVQNPITTNYVYVGDYFATLLIALGFGLSAFFIPYTRWSSDVAVHYVAVMGDSVSLSVRGLCGCFWTRSSLERQLQLTRVRQLFATMEQSTKKAGTASTEMGYEPHTGLYTSRIKTRISFLKSVFNVLQSMILLVEQIVDDPSQVDTPLCNNFGECIRKELAQMGATMDTAIVRISDVDDLITPEELLDFKAAVLRYETAVIAAREAVILNNDDYQTDHSDILLGFYLFSVEQLCDVISNFKENENPPSNLMHLLTFPVRDMRSSISAFKSFFRTLWRRGTLTRRMKEAIKISLCIVIAAYFQVYAMKNQSTSPVAGVDIIALVYKPTGAESFQYATNRLLGTVLGSLTGLLTVQIADTRRWVLYILTLILTCIGGWVQASPGYFPLGNAICNSVISVVVQYRKPERALVRIQQNCFAILTYFIISSLIWPVRGRAKVFHSSDISLRMFRESTCRLLLNLDMPESAKDVSSDVQATIGQMNKKIGAQSTHLPGAIAEPTVDSAEFPEIPWRMLIKSQKNLCSTLLMMRHAYQTFMMSTVSENVALSIHWVILRRLAPHMSELSNLVSAAVSIYLLALAKATMVPTAHLTRIRHGMMRCQRKIIKTYVYTLQREVHGDVDSRDDADDVADSNSSFFLDDDDAMGSGAIAPGAGAGAVGGTLQKSASLGSGMAHRPLRKRRSFNLGLRTPVASMIAGGPLAAGGSRSVFPSSNCWSPRSGAGHSDTKPGKFEDVHKDDISANDKDMHMTIRGADATLVAAPDDVNQAPRRPATKGYLAYKLRPDEEALLREMLNNNLHYKAAMSRDKNNSSNNNMMQNAEFAKNSFMLPPVGYSYDPERDKRSLFGKLNAPSTPSGASHSSTAARSDHPSGTGSPSRPFTNNNTLVGTASVLQNSFFPSTLSGLAGRGGGAGDDVGGDLFDYGRGSRRRIRRIEKAKAPDETAVEGPKDDRTDAVSPPTEELLLPPPMKNLSMSSPPRNRSVAFAHQPHPPPSPASSSVGADRLEDRRAGRNKTPLDADLLGDTNNNNGTPSVGTATSPGSTTSLSAAADGRGTAPREYSNNNSRTLNNLTFFLKSSFISKIRDRKKKKDDDRDTTTNGRNNSTAAAFVMPTVYSSSDESDDDDVDGNNNNNNREAGHGNNSKDSYGNSSSSNYSTTRAGGASKLLDEASVYDAENGEFILSNRDIHSLEAFLFGVRTLIAQIDEMERHLLAMIHDNEMAKKL